MALLSFGKKQNGKDPFSRQRELTDNHVRDVTPHHTQITGAPLTIIYLDDDKQHHTCVHEPITRLPGQEWGNGCDGAWWGPVTVMAYIYIYIYILFKIIYKTGKITKSMHT